MVHLRSCGKNGSLAVMVCVVGVYFSHKGTHAGLLALRILGTQQPHILERMLEFQTKQREIVEDKAARLESVGWEEYLKSHFK